MRRRRQRHDHECYLRASLDGQEFKTPAVKNDRNPDWGAALKAAGKYDDCVFHDTDVNDKAKGTVRLQVFDNDHPTHGKEVFTCVGEAEVPLKEFAFADGQWIHKEVELKEKGRANGGKVDLQMQFCGTRSPQDRKTVDLTKLIVTIVEGRNLKDMNKLVDDKPYVVANVVGKDGKHHEKFQTKTVSSKDGSHPVWQEEHTIENWHPTDGLEFQVKDKGALGSRTEGVAKLDAASLFPHGFSGAIPVSNVKNGEIHVRCVFAPKK